jgi:hypothetical protein
MATATPIAYNPSLSVISGTSQIGVFSVGTPTSGFTGNPRWWNSPDLDLGYVIGIPVPDCNVPTPNSGETACFSFYRASANTDQAFLSLTNYLTGISFTGTSNARSWLVNNLGYYTNYSASTPSLNDYYQGGIVGYIFRPGEPRYVSGETHGIIVSTETYGTISGDLLSGTGYTWGCNGAIAGLSETVGSGYTNQVTILNYLNANCSPSSSAYTQSAFLFATGLTDGGYTDWYVGSFNEYNTVFSGTGALNLPNYYPSSFNATGNAYVSSRQSDVLPVTNNFAAVFDSSYPPAYRPAGAFAGFKSGQLNVKPLRYF